MLRSVAIAAEAYRPFIIWLLCHSSVLLAELKAASSYVSGFT